MMYMAAGCRSMCAACIDEFANIGQIPQLEKLIATIRSQGDISLLLFCSRKSQLKGDL